MVAAHAGAVVKQTPCAVLAVYFSQMPVPAWKPLVMPAHVSDGQAAFGQPPIVMHVGRQVPTKVAWLHEPHGLVHASLQQTFCGEQKPDVQSSGVEHAAPLAAAGRAHMPLVRQTRPGPHIVEPDMSHTEPRASWPATKLFGEQPVRMRQLMSTQGPPVIAVVVGCVEQSE